MPCCPIKATHITIGPNTAQRQEAGRIVTIWTVSRDADGYRLDAPHHAARCLVGKAGLIAAADKREGDMATPVGDWPLRYVYFRPDRVTLPDTDLPAIALTPDMGWCDDPEHASYNMPVERPFAASHEELWREDSLYDVIVVLGHNDSPPEPFLGSAVFFHLHEADTRQTAGCVAVPQADMMTFLSTANTDTVLRISNGPMPEAGS